MSDNFVNEGDISGEKEKRKPGGARDEGKNTESEGEKIILEKTIGDTEKSLNSSESEDNVTISSRFEVLNTRNTTYNISMDEIRDEHQKSIPFVPNSDVPSSSKKKKPHTVNIFGFGSSMTMA
ncbi:hypothetical protein HAX54_001276 [Datura stramonium]|uniref:Uncharacterized protein n=1 Tax=Datura stramonium TaxID=4076 RepID=A0ABS8T3C4_DATST|nr:hypothetical protein [Datura stramonium]